MRPAPPAAYFGEWNYSMFGLMKARTCHLDGEQKLSRRLHYCGACKTIGRMYGHKSRLFLNNDTVFLGELLSAVSIRRESKDDIPRLPSGLLLQTDWAPAYQSYNCLSLPRSEADIPLPLKIAATATVVLTEFKIKDHIADSPNSVLKLAGRMYSKSFREASAVLQTWGFPIGRLRSCLESQSARENGVKSGSYQASPEQILRHLAEPTAAASALFFEHGVKLVGRGDLARKAYKIGFDFGFLIYLLDAFEDYEKDFRKDQFNAIRQAYRLSGPRLDRADRERVKVLLSGIADAMCEGLRALDLRESSSGLFTSRLRSNLSARLAVQLPVAVAEAPTRHCVAANRLPSAGPGARVKSAISTAIAMVRENKNEQENRLLAAMAAPIVFGSAVTIALLFPEQARNAASYRQCLGIAFNLMFVTALVRSVLAAPVRPLLRFAQSTGNPPEQGAGPPPPGGQFGPTPQAEPPPPKPKRGGSCCGDSSWCDTCDCCCECEACAECTGCCDCC
jgi:hypothetical protein